MTTGGGVDRACVHCMFATKHAIRGVHAPSRPPTAFKPGAAAAAAAAASSIVPASARPSPWHPRLTFKHAAHRRRLGAAAHSGGTEQDISGYTPANFVSFSDAESHTCRYHLAVDVEAPSDVCFDIWNDWNRIVDYMDLVSQVGSCIAWLGAARCMLYTIAWNGIQWCNIHVTVQLILSLSECCSVAFGYNPTWLSSTFLSCTHMMT
eukprot:356698-Chlamydomonas_euryale.AAC.5